MDQNFWFGKRVLITGGDGFVASHLSEKLLQLGAYVAVTVRHKRPIYTRDLIRGKTSAAGDPDIEQCELLDLSALRRICDRHQIDSIFHLAASAIVSDAANSPFSTIENNILSTLNILEVARINKIPRVLIVSTDKSYGDHSGDAVEPLPYRENYALRGLDVYSASKVCGDILAQTYSFQFKVPVVIARSCNIYGPGDLNFTRLIPRTIMCLLSDRAPVINRGNEHVLREYIYVQDVVDSYLLLLEKVSDYYGKENVHMPKSGKHTYGWAAFNIGSYTKADLSTMSRCGNIKNVSEIIKILREKITDVSPIIMEKPANFIEIPDQFQDAEKIMKLGFKSAVSLETGIDRSVAWYREKYPYLRKLAMKYIGLVA